MLPLRSFGRLLLVGLLAILCGVAAIYSTNLANQAVPDGEFKPGKLPEDVVAKLVPGLTLRFIYPPNHMLSGAYDGRLSRLAALHVPEGSLHSSVVRDANLQTPFHATLTGLLREKLNAKRQFKLIGTGDGQLRVNNKEVTRLTAGVGKESDEVALVQGYNLFEVVYASPPKGHATVRVFWNSDEFGWEPIPPEQLFTDGITKELGSDPILREGRLLYATHGCVQCHGLPAGLTLEQCAMPELRQQPPTLENAGQRFNADWLAAWISNPHALRPEATMPHVLQGETAKQQAADLAAYLASLKVGDSLTASKKEEELTADGEQKFIRLGCVACHHLDAPVKKDEHKRLSLYHLNAKFAPGALEAFLRAPHQHYSWSRMPDFKLDDDEAMALTSYFMSEAKGTIAADKAQGDAKRGQELFAEVGCAQCHGTSAKAALPGPMRPFPAPTPKGCIAEQLAQRGKAPTFVVDKSQREGLLAFLATGGDSLRLEVPAEFSMRQVKLLQCNACHNRDGVPSRWYGVLAEFGLQPDSLPHLTWTGEKLHPEWTEKLLAGQHENRARPWLRSRMPAWPTRAKMLATGLSHEHGFGTKEDPRPAPDAKLGDIGKKLLPQMGGFNCVQCHAVGGDKAVAPFDAEGINLLDAALRLRYDYYSRWMLFPKRIDPTAPMTQFSEDGKTTALTDILDGNARRQFDAIWHYMQTLPGGDKVKERH